jgi:hypothetical protein
MPTISEFYGIQIRMFLNDHPPPHFHARYAELEACFSVVDGAIIEGRMPPQARRLIREWAAQHTDELAENWQLISNGELPLKIGGLDANQDSQS